MIFSRCVRTFTRPELVQLFEECGYSNYRFYYPYPDYKFPTVIYSEDYLPRQGELTQNICNFDRDRLVLMDEEKVFDQIIKDGLFPLYSNSFFVEITKAPENPEMNEGAKREKSRVLYTKYSNGRSPEFVIKPVITVPAFLKQLYQLRPGKSPDAFGILIAFQALKESSHMILPAACPIL